jgi:light-regulated signal transduction histidine kinase (bacteriophytochrome)
LAKISLPEIQRKTVDLSALGRRVADCLQREEREWQGEVQIQPGLAAEGDEVLLEIALRHLFHNALKFSRTRSWALVKLGFSEQDEAYYVRDNGVGFDAAYAAKLFCPFQHLHADKGLMGRGVGLALVRRVIHQHGGRVRADSAPDQGATFYFTLPPAKE